MIDDRALFERAVGRFAPPDGSFERLVTRRERKRQDKRVAAGVVALLLMLAVIGVTLRAIDRSATPATPSVPRSANGDIAFVGGNVIDFSDDVSDFGVLYVVGPGGGTPAKLLA